MSTLSKSTLPGVGSPLRLAPASNFERVYALDEAWNAQDWETFDAYHDQDVVVYWPGREQTPTLGLRASRISCPAVTCQRSGSTGRLTRSPEKCKRPA
jgi:hypothetical protein